MAVVLFFMLREQIGDLALPNKCPQPVKSKPGKTKFDKTFTRSFQYFFLFSVI